MTNHEKSRNKRYSPPDLGNVEVSVGGVGSSGQHVTFSDHRNALDHLLELAGITMGEPSEEPVPEDTSRLLGQESTPYPIGTEILGTEPSEPHPIGGQVLGKGVRR